MRVIIACAGTAGHINPGLAIANKICSQDKDAQILFIGSHRKLEKELIPKAGYVLKEIDAYGLSKQISFDTLKKTIKTFLGYFQAKKIIKEFKPDIVIGTGGYICGPVIMAAHHLKIPTMLHESNAYPGKAIKMLSKYTNNILVSFKEAQKYIQTNNVIYVGTPVKLNYIEYNQEEKNKILEKYNLEKNKKVVIIFGGSQGAKKINDEVLDYLKTYKLNFNLIWAPGIEKYDQIKNELQNIINSDNVNNIKVVPYIYDMEEIMNLANLVIARSGAMTIAEITKLHKPALLIPLPNVSNNHQYYNAKTLEDISAAKIILNDNLNKDILDKEIKNIIENQEIEQSLANATKNIEEIDSTGLIYSKILELIDNSSNISNNK